MLILQDCWDNHPDTADNWIVIINLKIKVHSPWLSDPQHYEGIRIFFPQKDDGMKSTYAESESSEIQNNASFLFQFAMHSLSFHPHSAH